MGALPRISSSNSWTPRARMKTAYVSWRFKSDDDFFGSLKKKLEPATKLHWVDYGTEKRYKDDWLGADLGGQARPHFYDPGRYTSLTSWVGGCGRVRGWINHLRPFLLFLTTTSLETKGSPLSSGWPRIGQNLGHGLSLDLLADVALC